MSEQACGSPSEQEFPYLVRQFAIKRPCATVAELKKTLIEECQGESVSIEYRRSSGMLATLFVDVTDAGIFESYGKQNPVDLMVLLPI